MKKSIALSFLLILIFVLCKKDDTTPALDPPQLVAPANGSTITVNPPTLIWNKVNETNIAYKFEVATDSLFGTFIILEGSVSSPDTFYPLTTALAVGAYYWRACTRQDC